MAQTVQLNAPQKDSGYLVGDIIHTETIITVTGNSRLDALSLPVPGAVNASLDLLAIRVSETHLAGKTQFRIASDYQNFLATDQVTESEIPGYAVKLGMGQVRVPAWVFHVSPLRTVQGTSVTLPELKPDHGLAPLPTGPAAADLFAALGCAAVAAAAFAALRFRPAGFGRKLPFEQAWRDIKRLRRAKAPIETGFKSLHRAYTETAGQQIFAADLPGFTAVHRHFAKLARESENFFAASHAQFFARSTAGGWSWDKLAALAKALRRAERTRK